MEKITINTSGARSEIYAGGQWETAFRLIPPKNVIIVTDENVKNLYGEKFPEIPVLTIKPGEESKRIGVIESLAEKLLGAGIDRSGFVLAVGGGVVCDVAGFLASIYMRGIRCGYVSTTLLSQVDASTGGKTGVNMGGMKNMLGTFRQPEFVICDTSMLKTLPVDEYHSGLAELIKTAIIGDRELFELIERNQGKVLARNRDLLTTLVARSVKFKGAVVSEDELESGLRRILNFGHTFGHAIEMETGMKHGFAVAAGMELAAELSFEKGLLDEADKLRIIKLIKDFRLSGDVDIPLEKLENLIVHDKKKSGSAINFVFCEGIGKAVVEKVPVMELLDFYKRYREKK